MPVSKFTKERRAAIVVAVSTGNYPHAAARSAGISEQTYDRWMLLGREANEADEPPEGLAADYAAFYRDVSQAMGVGEVDLFDAVDKPDWKLERRWPERYGKRITIDVKKAAISHLLDVLRENLSDDAFDEVIAILDGED